MSKPRNPDLETLRARETELLRKLADGSKKRQEKRNLKRSLERVRSKIEIIESNKHATDTGWCYGRLVPIDPVMNPVTRQLYSRVKCTECGDIMFTKKEKE